jgi:uncharacterized protein (DUF4415 family)
MNIEFDPVKNEKNIRERGLSFERAAEFDFTSATFLLDERHDYGKRATLLSATWTEGCISCALWKQRTEFASSVFARPMLERPRNMTNRKPLTDVNGEVRELTGADFKAAVSFSALPESLRGKLAKRGLQKAATKERISIRLSRDVLEQFRAGGEGWQTRMDAALKDWLKTHSPA